MTRGGRRARPDPRAGALLAAVAVLSGCGAGTGDLSAGRGDERRPTDAAPSHAVPAGADAAAPCARPCGSTGATRSYGACR